MKNHDIKLIEGLFESTDARNLLLDLLSQKINYHRILKFNHQERYGYDKNHSEKRIKALIEEKERLIQWMKTLNENESISIRCNIQLIAG